MKAVILVAILCLVASSSAECQCGIFFTNDVNNGRNLTAINEINVPCDKCREECKKWALSISGGDGSIDLHRAEICETYKNIENGQVAVYYRCEEGKDWIWIVTAKGIVCCKDGKEC